VNGGGASRISRFAPIVLALWSGMQLTVGYAVAPLLFARLGDPVLAGAVAGELFRFVYLVGVPALLWARWALPVPRLLAAAPARGGLGGRHPSGRCPAAADGALQGPWA